MTSSCMEARFAVNEIFFLKTIVEKQEDIIDELSKTVKDSNEKLTNLVETVETLNNRLKELEKKCPN